MTGILIPEGVTHIATDAFCKCWNITSISLPESLEGLSKQAFEYMNLQSISLPCNVKTIPMYAFYECTNLQTVYGLSHVETIGHAAFTSARGTLTGELILTNIISVEQSAFSGNDGITNVVIGENIQIIGESAFAHVGCNSITILATNVPEVGRDAFNSSYLSTIYVPDESVETYKTAEGWSDYADLIKPLSEKPAE